MKRIFVVILSASFLLSACATDTSIASDEAEEKETTVPTGRNCGITGSRLGRCF